LGLYPKKLASACLGWAASRRLPKALAAPLLRLFVRHYGIDLGEAEKPLEEYTSLQEFFTRRLAPGARVQDEMAPGALNCPVDGRLVALGRVAAGSLVQAKGLPYRLDELLRHAPSKEIKEMFEGGHFLTLYLSPKDYHRVHVPLEGRVGFVGRVEGELWPVNSASAAHVPRLYVRNRRALWLAEGSGPDRGLAVACVMVGATHVGGCDVDGRWLEGRGLPRDGGLSVPALPCAPGDELGVFRFGSTVVLLVGGPGADAWLPCAKEGPVRVGMRLGRFGGQGEPSGSGRPSRPSRPGGAR
jgi:phosphatidylserine decarboxylase